MLFTPQEIETRPFLTERQGYDRHEVQSFLKAVANEFRTLVERIEALQEEVATAKSAAEAADERARAAEEARPEPMEAPAPVAAPAADPFVALGDEVAGVLRTAHETASTITGSAEEAAADVKKKAAEEADRLRLEADAARRNAGEEAGRIIAEARREADELLNAELGRHDLLRHAGDELRQRLEDARAALGQILTDVDNQPQPSTPGPRGDSSSERTEDGGQDESASDEYVG